MGPPRTAVILRFNIWRNYRCWSSWSSATESSIPQILTSFLTTMLPLFCKGSCQNSVPLSRLPYIVSVRRSGRGHLCTGVLVKYGLVLCSGTCANAAGPNPIVVIGPGSFSGDGSFTPTEWVQWTLVWNVARDLEWQKCSFTVDDCYHRQIRCMSVLKFNHSGFQKFGMTVMSDGPPFEHQE